MEQKEAVPGDEGLSRQAQPEKTSKTDGNASFLRAARAGNLEKVLEYLKGSTDINTSNANGLNALHLASKEGHVNIVTELLKRGANVDAATKKGNTALHIASLAGQEEIVKILVQQGAKINVQSQNGFTPLYMAAQENHAEVVKFLLANGASQGLATEDGFTPLAVALQQGHDKVVAVLLENDTRGKVRLPALHIAAKKDDIKAATLLLQSDHNVDGQSKSGFTPLHIAAHYGNLNIGSLLIEKEADVNFKARNAITPLHVASKWGRTKMVNLLLDNRANISCSTRDGLTPLHCAARSGHDPVEEILLEKGAQVNAKTKNGLSPLHMAAQGDHVDCARLLLYHKAPIDDVTVDYLTPLHVAAHCGNVRTAKLLLDRKCEVNARALNGFTPLHIACKKNRIKVVELLLKYGASIEATTESGLTPLHVASFMGHMNIVIYLIQHGANPDTPTVRGETALHLAARANQTDIIRILLRNGAQVDAKAREQQTPLHIASRLGNTDIVVLLLQHGASPDSTTKDNYTPLHICAKEGHEEVAAVLLEHGSSLNLTTKKGFTPLHIAAKYGNIKVVQLLLQKEADPNVQGKNGLTPLHVATHYNHVNVALLLLENGASPHCTAKNGYTPLHIAAKKNQMDIATTLLEYGAKPNAESKNGFTPLHLASQEGHTDMVSLLLEHGADVNCKAKNGLTPMHLAAQEDKVPVAEILVKHNAEIDPQTKAGYTPLHTACHFGQINMIRYLLEHDASVNATTKLGYTPLHQAAQQGHVLVINLLLKYKASPNAVTNTGQTPLSIAQRLGYISVVEVLKHITEVVAQQAAPEEKYKVVSPETMQETLMTDSEDEGASFVGEDTLEQSMSIDEKFLIDDSITPKDEFMFMERFSTNMSTSSIGPEDQQMLRPYSDDADFSPVFAEQMQEFNTTPDVMDWQEEKQLMSSVAPPLYAGKPTSAQDDHRPYGSYSGISFSSSFDPDNVAPDRQPLYSGSDNSSTFADNSILSRSSKITGTFLVSFMVDARGGAMRGCRHSGVRIIVPPGKACMPTRVTCKLVKKEKLMHPPPLMEGEALASRILEMGPVSAKFQGPVIIEVPHFAALRGKEREIVILRSDNGEIWREHTMEATEEAIHEALNGSFEDLESAEELYNKRITRILTTDFPQYFAVVTRIRQESKSIGPESGMLSSTVVPQVQAVFPEGSLTKKIKVGLQAQPIQPEAVSKLLGNRVAVSPIVTVEPRRRKFHKPITLTIPLPKASQKGMINQYGGDTPTLRLLCSITGGTSPAQWEDITGTTPLTFVNDCVSFTTTVSARFWLMDCQNINEAAKMATELYREAIAVPFMAKFVVFSKRHETQEARLRVFCMTDDKMDKTLETQEHFSEIARSRDVEVLEGKPQYVEMAGNLVPVTKSGDQLYINFHAFRENRLPFLVRVRDSSLDPVGRIAFMKEPKVQRGEAPQTPLCNLNVTLPDLQKGEPFVELDSEAAQELRRKYELAKSGMIEDQISKAELRLTDIADTLQGDWVVLARQLGITEEEINKIQTEYTYVSEQALVMLHLWVQKNGDNATVPVTGNELERALRKIGREDVIRKCMYNIEEVMDPVERAVAKTQIDQTGFDELKEELGPSRDSTLPRGMSLDVSYDEQDIMKESESAGEESSDAGSVVEKRVGSVSSVKEDGIIPEVNLRHGVIITPTEEEERQISAKKHDAYVTLAQQMSEQVDIEAVIDRSPEPQSPIHEERIAEQFQAREPAQVDDLIERVEAIKVEGMDDRLSRSSSEDSLVARDEAKDGVHDKHVRSKTKTPPPSPAERGSSQEQEVTEAQLAERLAETDTWADPDQLAAPLEGTPLHTEAPGKDVAARAQQKPGEQVIVAKTVAPEKAGIPGTFEDWAEDKEIVKPDDISPVSQEAAQVLEVQAQQAAPQQAAFGEQTFEEWAADKELSPKRSPLHAGSEVPLAAHEPDIVREVIKGDVTQKEDVQENEQKLPDGRSILTRVTTVEHYKPVIERILTDGVESTNETQEVIGTEVEEDVTEFPPGVTEPYGEGIETESSVEQFEDTLPDGTWIKKRTIKTTVRRISDGLPPQEEPTYQTTYPMKDQVLGEKQDSSIEVLQQEPIEVRQVEESIPTEGPLDSGEEPRVSEDEGHTEPRVAEPGQFTEHDRLEEAALQAAPVVKQDDQVSPDGELEAVTSRDVTIQPTESLQSPEDADIHEGKAPSELVAVPTRAEPETLSEPVPESVLFEKGAEESEPVVSRQFEEHAPFDETKAPTKFDPEEDLTEIPAGSVKITTAIEEGEPLVDTDVQEFEEVLPDGTVVKRRVIKTSQKQTITKHVTVEGLEGETIPEAELFPDTGEDVQEVSETLPDGTIVTRKVITKQEIIEKAAEPVQDLTEREGHEVKVPGEFLTETDQVVLEPTKGEDADSLALTRPAEPESILDDIVGSFDAIKVTTDTITSEPEIDTDVQEFEEVLPDGTVVKRRIVKTSQKQTVTQHVTVEGPEGELPGREEIFQDQGASVQEFKETLPDGTIVTKRVVTTQEIREGQLEPASPSDHAAEDEEMPTTEDALQSQKVEPDELLVTSPHAVPIPSDLEKTVPETAEEKAFDAREQPPTVTIPDDSAPMEDGAGQMVPAEGEVEEAAGGDIQTTRVVMKKQVHKKTIIRDGKEEVLVTEDTHIEQDNEGPEELRESMQQVIDQFMVGSGEIGQSPAQGPQS